jgi:hypothetical protein
MVEKPPSVIYASNPPQWDRVMWCACGHTENLGRTHGESAQDSLLAEWKRMNPDKTGEGNLARPNPLIEYAIISEVLKFADEVTKTQEAEEAGARKDGA